VGLDENLQGIRKGNERMEGAGEKSGLRGRRERACEEARAGRARGNNTHGAGAA
jgi:hypothetical protein